jgi:uncharacterized protein (DUF1697 family)
MPKYIAFLRAINVGGRTVKMDHLRRLFESLGLSRVETFIASGNVSFESTSRSADRLAAAIEKGLQDALGYGVATFLRSPAELTAIARHKPFDDSELSAEGNMLYVAFVAAAPGAGATQKLQACATAVDAFHVHDRQIYWLRRSTAGESAFSGARLEKILGVPATLRNLTTVRKIAAHIS